MNAERELVTGTRKGNCNGNSEGELQRELGRGIATGTRKGNRNGNSEHELATGTRNMNFQRELGT